MSQVKIDFLVTGNMSSLHKQVQTLNAELMAVAGSMTAVDRSMSNVNLQAANAQLGRMLTTSGQFTQQMVTMRTSTDLFAESLSRQNVSMRQAFNETRNYVMRRGGLIRDLAKQQVMMQNSMVMPHGVSPTGRVTASVITPTGLDKDFATQMRVANKSWEVFNATAQQGATHMVNWGKNTQWAGRQLMVGFTVPLMIAGGLAAKTFKELDEELVRLQKVYGSGFSFGDDFVEQSKMIREAGIQMAKDMAQAYGQAGTDTAALMADLAATGFEGEDLMRMTEQTTKLATLGEVDRQEAMKATVALQSAFKMSTNEVADSVLFLNAVENQTSASLQDLVEAIPRAGTVIKGLGGSVEDLALYMTAMREGGISAAEGANALKSGLSSIIAPPQAAVDFMKDFGINLPKIVQQNAGDLTGTIMAFQKELKGLDDLARQQVITKLFGKYQFARMSAFFENLGAQGSQTQKVLDLMGTSMEDLGKLAEQEIGAQAESVSGKWKRAWEEFKVNLAVVGEDLLSLGTKVVSVFNSLFGFLADNEWLMKFVKYLGLAAAAIGPIIMMMGLFGNMIGMIVKGILRLSNGFMTLKSGGGIARTFEMLTAESFQADTAVEQLTGSMYEQKTAQEVLTQAVREYTLALEALQGQAVRTAASTEAVLNTAAVGDPRTLAALQQSARAGSIGFALSTRADNDITGKKSIDYARLAALPNNKLAGWGSTMAITQAMRSGQFVDESGAKMSAGAIGGIVAAAKKGDAAAVARLKAIMAANDELLTNIYNTERQELESNRREYILKRQILEIQLQNESSLRSAGADAKKYVVGAGLMAGELGGYNRGDIMRPESIFSTRRVDFNASATADEAQALEHVSAAMSKAEEDLMVLSQNLQKLSSADAELVAKTEALMAQIVKSTAAKAGVTLTDEQAIAEARKYIAATADMASQQQMFEATLTEWITSLKGADGKTDLTARAMDTLQKAILKAAGEVSSIELRQIQTSSGRLVGAINTATGKVIAGTTFEIGLKGAAKATDAADAMQALKNATEDQILSTEKLTREQQVATAATEVDSAAERQHTAATLADTGAEEAEVGANMRAVAAENEETAANMLAANQARARAAVADIPMSQAPVSRFSAARSAAGSGFSRLVSSPRAPMYAGGALMGGAMLGSMMLPAGGASNIANMTMMGAGVGGMFGPWGMAIGGAAGLITGGLSEAFKSAQEEAKRQAEIAAANWEAEFGKIDISQQIADQLKLGTLDTFRIPSVDLSGVGADVKNASEEFKSAIAEGMKDQIEEVKKMGDEEAAAYGKRMYTNLVASGADPTRALQATQQVLYQAGQTAQGAMLPAEVVKIDNEKKAEQLVSRQLEGIAKASMKSISDTVASGGFLSAEELETAGRDGGLAYFNGLQEAFETGAISQDKYFSKTIQGFKSMTDAISGGKLESAWDSISGDPDAMNYLNETLGTTINNYQDLKSALESLPDDRAQQLLDTWTRGTSMGGIGLTDRSIDAFMDLGAATQAVDAAQVQYLASVRASDPAIAGAAERLAELNEGMSLEQATLLALRQARELYNQKLRETAMISSLIKMATPYVDDMPEKTNIAQLQRQEDRKLEALRESEDARLEAMQEAAEKRERLMEKEINQTERQYDKEIEQIQRAEDKRQEAFENEQERAQRRQEMRNMEISYQEAIANGDLFEAARIRMDIAATKKQREAQSREEKRQEKADNKIGKLEKEKNQKLRILNQELRQEQRANEKALEAAQEASDKRIEMAEKESQQKVKAAEQANKDIEKDQRDTNEALNKMMQALLDGDRKTFREQAKLLGIDARERSKLISDFVAKQFEFLPDKLFNYLAKGITTGNWDLLDELMKMTINGATNKEIKDRIDWQATYDAGGGGPASSGSVGGMATGGLVTGPGSGTSDSVPRNLSNGEYVIRQSQVARLGKSFFDKINNGHNVGKPGPGGYGMANGGLVSPIIAGMLKTPMDMIKRAKAAGAAGAGATDQFGGVKGAAPGDIVYWDGEPIDQLIAKQLRLAGRILGSRYTVYQGSYQPQTSYSGTTHTDGGVVDTQGSGVFSPEVVALQKAGFAAWYRGPGAPGAAAAYPAHIHAVSLFSKNLDTNAAYQRDRYLQMSGDGISGPYYGPHVAPIGNIRTKLGLRKGGRINYDNTIANLHRGETVLTKSLTDKFEDRIANVGGNEYNFDVTIQGNVDSSVNLRREFEKFVVAHEKKQQTRAGRSRRV